MIKKWRVEAVLKTNSLNGDSEKQLECLHTGEHDVGAVMRRMINKNMKHTKKVFNNVELNVYNQNDIRVAWHLVQSV